MKFHRVFVSIVLSVLLLLGLMLESNVEARGAAITATTAIGGAGGIAAAGGAVAGLAAWEVILPCALVALGAAGIAYIVSNSDDFEKMVDDSAEYVEKNGGKIRFDPLDLLGKPTVEFNYYDNRTYIDKYTMELVARWAIEYGLFSSTEINIPDYNTSDTIEIKSLCNIKDLVTYVTYPMDWISESSSDVKDIFNGSNNKIICVYYPDYYNNVSAVGTVSIFISNQDYYIGDVVNLSGGLRGQRKNINFSKDLNSNELILSSIGSGTGAVSGYNIFVGKYVSGSNSDGDFCYASNINVDIKKGNGNENIPSMSGNTINMPRWNGDIVSINNIYNYPVTFPPGYEIPVIAPVGYDWGDLPSNVVIPDYPWSDPYPEAPQNDWQDGDYGNIIENPVGGDDVISRNFVLPSGVMRKFPFSVPYDAVYLLTGLSSNSVSAPHYEWDYDLAGRRGKAVIDLAEWDGAASVFRKGFFIVFLVGLVIASNYYIRR